jgi:ATP-dependent metalloprotease
LVELDGFKTSEGVIILAATNFPEMLDPALVRPGRFDRQIAVPLPDIKGRREILAHYLKPVPLASDVDVDKLARATSGMSGADLANVVNTAALEAAKSDASKVAQAHLTHALERVLMGAERVSAVIPEHVRKSTAYHEGGHALVVRWRAVVGWMEPCMQRLTRARSQAMLTRGSLPLHKATIVPRGHSLGMVVQLPEEKDMLAQTKHEIYAQIDICLGGRIAEEVIFGAENISSGAGSDLQKATRLAHNMVANYGMLPDSQIGLSVVDSRNNAPETMRLVDLEVRRILDESATRVRHLIKSHRSDLEAIAHELLEKETLSSEDLKQLLKL